MAKEKFVLTADLINVESEPVQDSDDVKSFRKEKSIKVVPAELKEGISLKISKRLKDDFQVFCVKNNIKMTEGLELALSKFISSPFLK